MPNDVDTSLNTAAAIRRQLKQRGSFERAEASAWFFKTGPGQYGEGDKFYGVKVPETRAIIAPIKDIPLSEVKKLLLSDWHEERLAACLLLVKLYRLGEARQKKAVYDFYLAHGTRINNWDLVDSSAEHIVGPQLEGTDFSVLKKLAVSKNLWERRIAMLSCFYFIKQGEAEPALMIAEILADDQHDLIQKAVGWMLREVGKRVDTLLEETWLQENSRYKTLPRTTLRYAIEHFSPERRQAYLKGRI